MSSLKSPSITQGMLHSVTCLNSLVSTVISVALGTLGDLYTTAILLALGNCIVADTASMPLLVNLCTLDGFMWLGTQQHSTFVLTCNSITSDINLII